jgi:DNA-binding response OmpR family regulator
MELPPRSSSFATNADMIDEPIEARVSILVVEDEVLIRMMVVETLEEAGFQMSEAANGKTALQAVEASGEELRAVILDVGLPDTSGEELIDKIRALRPDMRIIVTTGYDTNELRLKLRDDPLARILAKPFQPEMLNTILKEWGITV